MPYVMIPAFHPSAQSLTINSDPQMSMPLQPIPCKPGQWSSEQKELAAMGRVGLGHTGHHETTNPL